MKTAIVYYSAHHGNTKKLLDAIAEKHDVTLIDAVKNPDVDLSAYDLIGFASGIYYSKFHKSVLTVAENRLPNDKKVFFMYTCGRKNLAYSDSIAAAVKGKNPYVLGALGVLGFDTFGPFKLVGGIAKNHPDNTDLDDAVKFYERVVKDALL